MKILNRWNQSVIWESPCSTMLETLQKAVVARTVLTDAVLTGAVLTGADLRGAVLTGADLRGAVLTDAVLTGADLRGADLRGADLRGAVLTDAVLTGAVLTEAPTVEHLDSKILERIRSGGTLKMQTWHTCETTHCRGGWAILVAGEEGRELEKKIGTQNAATMIYIKSTSRVPDFFATDEEAMADLVKCAAEETK